MANYSRKKHNFSPESNLFNQHHWCQGCISGRFSACVCLSFVRPVPRGWRHHHRHHSYQFHVGLQQLWRRIAFINFPPRRRTCSKEKLHTRGVRESYGSQGKGPSSVHLSLAFKWTELNWFHHHLQKKDARTWMPCDPNKRFRRKLGKQSPLSKPSIVQLSVVHILTVIVMRGTAGLW